MPLLGLGFIVLLLFYLIGVPIWLISQTARISELASKERADAIELQRLTARVRAAERELALLRELVLLREHGASAAESAALAATEEAPSEAPAVGAGEAPPPETVGRPAARPAVSLLWDYDGGTPMRGAAHATKAASIGAAPTATQPTREPAPQLAPAAPPLVAAASPRAPARPVPAQLQEPTLGDLIDRLLARLGFGAEHEARVSRAGLEAWLEGRMLAVVGGVALLLGAIFFLSLAFSRGWITEEMRVVIGLAVGALLFALGELSFSRLRGILGLVLVAVGLAIVSLALLAATRLYGLVPVEWGLAGAFVAACAAAAIAVRHDSELVAAFGLIAVLAAPPVLGASPTTVTLLFVAAALVGTTGVALFRTWSWLPALAFALAAPQLASYVLGTPPVAEGLVAVGGFWLVNLFAAGGEEARHRTDVLRVSTVTLLLADAAFTVWAGFTVLGGEQEVWRGPLLAVLAVLHLALAASFLARYGDRHPFGLVVAGTGLAALAMSVPVRYGGPPVPIAWAAEAVALAWVAALRRHPYSAAVSVALGALALAHLIAVEYPPDLIDAGFVRDVPFAGPEGMTFAFMLAALALAGVVVPIAWIRVALAAVGGLVAVYVMPFELSGPALVAGWAAVAAAGGVLFVRVVDERVRADYRETRTGTLGVPAPIAPLVAESVSTLSGIVRPWFAGVPVLAAIAALAHLAAVDYPLGSIWSGTPHEIPFIGLPGLAAGIVLAALASVAALVRLPWLRLTLATIGLAVIAYAAPFELSGPSLVWAWAVLATAGFCLEGLVLARSHGAALGGSSIARLSHRAFLVAAAIAGLAALTHVIAMEFPPLEIGAAPIAAVPYIDEPGIALGAILASLAVSAWALRALPVRLAAAGSGVALVAYSASFQIVQPAAAIAWGALALASLSIVRRLVVVPALPPEGARRLATIAERGPYLAAGLALALLAVRSLWLADPGALRILLTGSSGPSAVPFVDERSLVLVVLAGALASAGWIWRGTEALAIAAVAAGIVVAWLLPFELRVGHAVAGWSALVVAGFWAARRVPVVRVVVGGASLVLLGVAVAVAIAFVAPPSRLVVDELAAIPAGWPLTDATIALAGIGLALGAGAYLHRDDRLVLGALGGAGVAAVYLLSLAVVDWFQRQVGTAPIEDLQKEAQVGLSVLWSILGGGAFAVGLARRLPPVRLFGLGLLGLATVKVFAFDLAALDVAYRVLSLVALGVLLLVSALVYARSQHPHGPVGSAHV